MRLTILLLLLFIRVCWADSNYAQNARISIDVQNQTIAEILDNIEQQSEFSFIYDSKSVDTEREVTMQAEEENIFDVLSHMFSGSEIAYTVINKKIILNKGEEVLSPAQQDQKISGTITDMNNEPLPGASIKIKGSSQGTVADANGAFSLIVPDGNSILVFSYLGYVTREITVGNNQVIDARLIEDLTLIEEVVVVGYGVQRKATLTGAVSAVRGEEILTTKNSDMQNTLTGKLPGVRVYQKTAEPGAFNANFDIRGFGAPLVVIDGVISDMTAFQRLDANDIDNLSVLKDGSASIYGVRAANGVLLVTTNRGKNTDGKTTLSYSGNFGWDIPSGSPKSTSVADYMMLRNEKIMRNVNQNNTAPYSADLIQQYRNGEFKEYDWWEETMQAAAPKNQHSLSVSGGNSKVTYYMAGGYVYNESFLRSNDYNYQRFNLRSNISANVTDRLKVSLNMYGMMDTRNQGTTSADWTIRAMQRYPPTMPVYVNDDPRYLYFGAIEGENTVAMTTADISGYVRNEIKEFNGNSSVSYQVPYIDGLTANAMFSYRYRINDNTTFTRQYEMFSLDEATKEVYSRGFRQSPSSIRRQFYSRPQMLYNLSLDYKRKFNDHNIGILALWEGSRRQSNNFYAQRDLSMDIDYLFAGNSANQQGSMSSSESNFYNKTNQALVGRFQYDFRSKYLFEFAFRNDGSSVWDEAGRWGFFPSVSGGWRVSEENFWKSSALNVVNNFKLRASYGEMGDDSTADGYTWLQGWDYPAVSGNNSGDNSSLVVAYNRLPNGYYFDGVFVSAVSNRGITNPNISWMVSKIINLGVDVDIWNGLFGASFEYFKRDRTGRLATRDVAIPSTLGASLPQENLNSDRNMGFELELRHNNKINDFKYSLTGMVAYTRRMVLHREIARAGNSWLNYTRWDNENRYQGIHVGRDYTGQRFQSYEEIANSLVYYSRSTLPGDYIYVDWNGDGRINGLDDHPIAYEQNATPPLYFSLNTSGEWKGFDLTMLWQGAAMAYVRYVEELRDPGWGADNANFVAFFLDRWHPTVIGANPYEHTTVWIPGQFAATGSLADESSRANLYNTSYLRLKTIELGYTIPPSLLHKVNIQGLRLYANSYNPFTIKNKSLVTDPEHTSDTWGNAYPIALSFSVGVNIKF